MDGLKCPLSTFTAKDRWSRIGEVHVLAKVTESTISALPLRLVWQRSMDRIVSHIIRSLESKMPQNTRKYIQDSEHPVK